MGSLAHELDSTKKTLISPYGTNKIIDGDDRFVKQLQELDVDIIAYQDEVGVRKTQVEQLDSIWQIVARAHSQVPDIKLWADVEIFNFEGDVYKSPLLPAEYYRVSEQIVIASKHVEKILIYQYQGMLNSEGTSALCEHHSSVELRNNYCR